MPTSQRLAGGKQRPCGNTSSASYHHSISRCLASCAPWTLATSTQSPVCCMHPAVHKSNASELQSLPASTGPEISLTQQALQPAFHKLHLPVESAPINQPCPVRAFWAQHVLLLPASVLSSLSEPIDHAEDAMWVATHILIYS